MAMFETTDDDFQYYIHEFEYWREYWGLKDWLIDFQHAYNPAMEEDNPPLGSINAMYEDKYAIVYFSPVCPETIYSEKEIAQTAFHEAAELLLMEFWLLANSRHGTTLETLTKACHDVIHRLTNTAFVDYWYTKDQLMFECEIPLEDSEDEDMETTSYE